MDALQYPRITDSLTLDKFRTDFAITRQNLEDAQNRYDELASRPETDLERADALNALIEARRAHYLATINLNWAEGKTTQAEIDQAQVALELAKANYDKATAEVQRWETDSPTSELAMAKLTLADAEARFMLAKKAQEAVELRAPFAGQVLSLGIAPGSSIKAFQAVLTLANPAELEIRAIPSTEDFDPVRDRSGRHRAPLVPGGEGMDGAHHQCTHVDEYSIEWRRAGYERASSPGRCYCSAGAR